MKPKVLRLKDIAANIDEQDIQRLVTDGFQQAVRKSAGIDWTGSWNLTDAQRKAISDRTVKFVDSLEIEVPCPKKFARIISREALTEARRYAANRLKDEIIEDLKQRVSGVVKIVEIELAAYLSEDLLSRMPDLPEEVKERIRAKVRESY